MHVGAYAPQIPTVDLVVNAAWGEELGMTGPNALLVSARGSTPQGAEQADREAGRRPGSAEPGHREPARPGSGCRAGRGARRHLRRRGGHLPLHRAQRWPHRPRTRMGEVAHHHRGGADPGLGHLQQGDLPAAQGGARARSFSADWPTRSTPTSTPAATTRASSPAPPSCPTTPSASRSTSTCRATSAAPSARSTVTWSEIFKSWGFGWGGDWNYTDPMHFEMNRIVNPG